MIIQHMFAVANLSFRCHKTWFIFNFFFSPVGHEPEHWSVYRRYLEFYVLESKLTEFHGMFSTIWKAISPLLIVISALYIIYDYHSLLR